MNIYKLEKNISAEEAQKNAVQFDVVSDPYSTETDTGVIQYIFTNPAVSGDYFSQYKTSASFHYHHALTTVGLPVDFAQATEKKDLLIKTIPYNIKKSFIYLSIFFIG